jgi:hypothetical protein
LALDAEPVIVIPDLDAVVVTADRLPRTPGLLPCGGCGAVRDHHWRSYRAGECTGFRRPPLPPGHAYADTLAAGSLIRRHGQVDPRPERVRSWSRSATHRGEPMVVLQLESRNGPPTVAYLSPDVIVEVLEAADVTGEPARA